MATTINSILPPEIIFLILEYINAPRADIFFTLLNAIPDDPYQLTESYYYHSQSLVNAALVCKSWTHPAQTLLLRSVILNADELIPHLLNAPLSQFQVNYLYLVMPSQPETASPQVGNLLSELNGLKSLHLLNDFTGCVGQVLDVSMFSTPGLSKLESLDLSNLSITNKNNVTLTIPTFKLKELNITNVDISESAAKSFVTPALTKLSITQFGEGTQSFVNVLKLAAPHLEYLHMDLHTDQATNPYISIIPLCTSVTEFSFSFLGPRPSFLSIISDFAANQLLHLKLIFNLTTDLPNLLTVLSLPSLRKLQSLTLIAYKYKQGTLEEVAVPIEVSAECTRRHITYKYQVHAG